MLTSDIKPFGQVLNNPSSETEESVVRTRAAIYVRVSSLEQAENGWSIRGQLDDIRNYCDSKDYRVVRIYRDAGFSGSDIERPGLLKMLEHVSMGVIDVAVLWRYDRLSRNNVDFPALLHFFNTHDVKTESVRTISK